MGAFVTFCQTLSKDLCKASFVKHTLRKTVELAKLFRSTHVASDSLSNEKSKFEKVPQNVESYSVRHGIGLQYF